MRAALLEDDPDVSLALAGWLEREGWHVSRFGDGDAVLRAARRESFDCFVLDWQVPGASGEEVLRHLRGELANASPVIFVTARDAEADIAAILSAGADDYLVKPVRRLELLARIAAVRRRIAPAGPAGRVQAGDYVADFAAREIRRGGERVELSDKEYELAAFLFARVDALVSKGHVAQSVWGHGDAVLSRTVDVHVGKLRRKLALGPERGLRLVTIYGMGYRLERVSSDAPT